MPISETASDTMSRAAEPRKQDSAMFFPHLFQPSRLSVCAVTVMAAAAATACQPTVFTAPEQGKAETLVVCDQTCLSLFCLPR